MADSAIDKFGLIVQKKCDLRRLKMHGTAGPITAKVEDNMCSWET
jgi:hypothetical protein